MPIVVDVDVMLAKRKLAVGELAERVGITPANLAVLKNGRAKAVRFTTLASLCEVLECQPGDLLRWEPQRPAEPRGQMSNTTIALRVVADLVRHHAMARIGEVRVARVRTVEGDDEAVVKPVLQAFRARRSTLDDADDARDRAGEISDGRSDALLGNKDTAVFPGHEYDMGYRSHRLRLTAR